MNPQSKKLVDLDQDFGEVKKHKVEKIAERKERENQK